MNGITTTTNSNPKQGEVWLADFPYEESDGRSKKRPVAIVSNVRGNSVKITELDDEEQYLATKITSHDVREEDYFDTIIIKWKEANLHKESVARVSKTIILPRSSFVRKLGDMDEVDYKNILIKYVEFIQK